MSEIHPVNHKRHRDRAWNKATDFNWARHEQTALVALKELPQLLTALPLGFVKYESGFRLVALLGLRSGESLMVGTDGRWLPPYLPLALRHYPFRLLRNAEGREILGIDEAGLLERGASGSSALYDENGAPAPELSTIIEQLIQDDKERQRANCIVDMLDQHGLLEPWLLQIQQGSEMRKIEGLYRINETQLNALSAEALLELRNAGGLLMAYGQLLSMRHVHQMGRLGATGPRLSPVAAVNLLDDHGTISFANL